MGERQLSALSPADALEIGTWRYDAPYDTYDAVGDVMAMADPTNRYLAIRREDELIGFVCFAAEARVRGLEPAAQTEDIGWGLRPDLVGQGESRTLLPWVIARVEPELNVSYLRVVIAAWNERSLRAARCCGFEPAGVHEAGDDVGRYLLLRRPTA